MSIVIHFRIRISSKKKAKKDSFYYIYCRLRINRVPARSDMSTGVKCRLSDWDSKAQRIKGHSEHVRQQNAKLEKFRSDLDEIYNDLRKYDKPVTSEIVKQIYMKKDSAVPKTLLAYYQKYIDDVIKTKRADATITAWETRMSMVQLYIEKKLKRKEIDLLEVTPKWIRAYIKYQLVDRGNGLNYASRQALAIISIMDFAVEDEAIPYNCTNSLSLEYEQQKPIKFLTEAETQLLYECSLYDKRLRRVVDCFILQCYTGFAYNELFSFDAKKHLKTEEDGEIFIKIYRGKNKELCLIPLLSQAKEILEKYNYCPPVVPIRTMNLNLKHAAKVAEINKDFALSTHVGRSTAGTFLLNRGVQLHIVSKILGHRSVKVTEARYAFLLTKTIKDDIRGKV